MKINLPPEIKQCEGQCRMQFGSAFTTAMYYTPTFDKYGNNVNPDGNITRGTCSCLTCGTKWSYEMQYGDYKWTKN